MKGPVTKKNHTSFRENKKDKLFQATIKFTEKTEKAFDKREEEKLSNAFRAMRTADKDPSGGEMDTTGTT